MTDYRDIVRHPGNVALFEAVEISLLALNAGWPLHLHAEGVRGTGKTTVLRAARHLLPPLQRIAGCPYNCDPARPHCPLHRGLDQAAVAALGTEWVPRPFLEISHSARLGTVVGSIDLGGLSRPEGLTAALLPGTLPQAHRGIVVVDEINRLAETAPELADVLLDAMGTRPGRVQIEEAGLPTVAVPVELVVWAASNPDEDPGPLRDVRRQLSDRFDLNVELERPPGPNWVEQVLLLVDQRLGAGQGVSDNDAVSSGPVHVARGRAAERADDRTTASGNLVTVTVSATVRRLIADVYSRFGLESLRAAEGLQVAGRAAAVMAGRTEVTRPDIRRAAALVLRHRLEPDRLQRCLQYLDGDQFAETGLSTKPAAAPLPANAGLAEPNTVRLPQRPQPRIGEGTQSALAHTHPASGPGPAHPLFQRVWQRLARQSATATAGAAAAGAGAAPAGANGRGRGGSPQGGSHSSPQGSGDNARQITTPGQPSLAPPHIARSLRQVPPEQWLTGPDQS